VLPGSRERRGKAGDIEPRKRKIMIRNGARKARGLFKQNTVEIPPM
jgi:hypothetical protein